MYKVLDCRIANIYNFYIILWVSFLASVRIRVGEKKAQAKELQNEFARRQRHLGNYCVINSISFEVAPSNINGVQVLCLLSEWSNTVITTRLDQVTRLLLNIKRSDGEELESA